MKKTTATDYRNRILTVLAYMDAHWNESLVLEELAAIACFSPYHFHRIYRSMVGETLATTLRRIRLYKAAECLVETQQSVTEIAFESGYQSAQAFSRAFRTDFGMSPSDYRNDRSRCKLPPSSRLPLWLSHENMKEEMKMDISIVDLDPMDVMSLRHIGPYEQVGQAFERLVGWAKQSQLWSDHSKVLGLSYDDPETTPSHQLRYDACVQLATHPAPTGEFQPIRVDGGRFAMFRHIGPYSGIGDAFRHVFGVWLPQSGYEVDDRPCLEMYPNDPADTPPAELITEIYVPLKV